MDEVENPVSRRPLRNGQCRASFCYLFTLNFPFLNSLYKVIPIDRSFRGQTFRSTIEPFSTAEKNIIDNRCSMDKKKRKRNIALFITERAARSWNSWKSVMFFVRRKEKEEEEEEGKKRQNLFFYISLPPASSGFDHNYYLLFRKSSSNYSSSVLHTSLHIHERERKPDSRSGSTSLLGTSKQNINLAAFHLLS